MDISTFISKQKNVMANLLLVLERSKSDVGNGKERKFIDPAISAIRGLTDSDYTKTFPEIFGGRFVDRLQRFQDQDGKKFPDLFQPIIIPITFFGSRKLDKIRTECQSKILELNANYTLFRTENGTNPSINYQSGSSPIDLAGLENLLKTDSGTNTKNVTNTTKSGINNSVIYAGLAGLTAFFIFSGSKKR